MRVFVLVSASGLPIHRFSVRAFSEAAHSARPAGDEFLRRLRLGAAELDLIRALVEENGLAIPAAEQVERPLQADIVVVAVENQNYVRPSELIDDKEPPTRRDEGGRSNGSDEQQNGTESN